MEFLKTVLFKILELSAIQMEKPEPYGDYHILCFAVFGVITLLVCAVLRDCRDSTYRFVIFLFWLSLAVWETYKETVISHRIVGGEVVFSYPWSAFPFQLCSTPLYVLPLLAALPDSWLRDAFACYTAAFAFIGGFGVFLFPRTVFGASLFGNIHSMNHHGIQIVTGVFTMIWYRRRRRLNFRFFLLGEALFTGMFMTAMWLNTVFYEHLKTIGKHHGFNMFFINPSEPFKILIFEDILNKISKDIIHVYYFIGVTLLAFLIWLIAGIGTRSHTPVPRKFSRKEYDLWEKINLCS